jgi:hypothetical protein
MRAPLITSLLATAWFAGGGCNSAPQQDPPVASQDRACTNAAYDPLHMVSSKAETTRDPDIESLLNQSADPRLAWVNRQMYLSLRSLDMELHREQRVAECEHPQSSQMLEARSGGGAAGSGDGAGSVVGGGTAGGSTGSAANRGSAGGGAMAGGGSAPVSGVVAMTTNSGTGGASTSATATVAAASQSSIAVGATPGTARSTLVRKSSLSASGAGGNGAVAQKISAGSDNDIVARRLRKAAEQETDPALRAKLWKEYTDFRQGMSTR